LGNARAFLRRYWPGPHQTDLRNWEWRDLAQLSDGDPHISLVAHTTWVRSLRFLDDQTLLTAGSADWRRMLWNLEMAAAPPDGSAYLWDLATRRRRVLPRALTAYISLSFSPDGSRLGAGSYGEGKIFDTASGRAVLSLDAPGLLAFARDGQKLMAARGVAASIFHAPPFSALQFAWLSAQPSEEAPPPYRGPYPDYVRPDRPAPKTSR
jgi:hypothetical protein